jgi:acetyl-CoA carboxylase carboxyl transferase subunit alpha
VGANDILQLKLVDEVIPEPLGGAHRDLPEMVARVKARLVEHLDTLAHKPMTRLLADRYDRLMRHGVFEEPQVVTPIRQAS